MATHSSILAWRIPPTEKPNGTTSPWGGKESDTASDFEVLQKVDIKLRSLHYSHINATALKLKMSQTLKIVNHYIGIADT